MTVTFKGNPVTLVGVALRVGDKLPSFTLTDLEMNAVNGATLHGARVFVAVPSLDTGVCDLEAKKFNQKATELSGVSVYVVSMDLPFAQARWCGATGSTAVHPLSDYRDRSFGRATGTLIEGLALLTRAVFLVDAQDTVVYAEYVPEVGQHPDYDAVFAALTTLVK